MKHKLLFLLLILFSFQNSLFAQAPCGITTLESCDDDANGLAIFDITVFDNIYPFCMVNADPNLYYAPTHHLTQADADTGTNPIANPESFESSNGQPIFMRAEPLNSGTHSVLAFQTYELTLIFSDASFFMTPTCDGATATITGTPGGAFNFNPAPPDGATINTITGTVTGAVSGETYSVEYTISGACGSTSIETFIAGCLYGIIEVNAFVDENSNTVFDASELNFNQGVITYEINNDGIIHYMSSYYGVYLIPVFEEGDTYDISFTLSEVYNSCLSQTFSLVEDVTVTEGETLQVNFPLTQMGECNEIGIYLTSNASPRPGQINYNILAVVNLGTEPISGSVDFTYDVSLTLLDVLHVEPGNSVTNTANGFVLNFNDLQPGEEEAITVRLNVPTNANSGDIITNSAIYNVDDLILENNESILTQTVVNSYDPNDKMESHGPKIKFDDFTDEDYLYYTIRFQNLGTAEAIDISIEDVLEFHPSKCSMQVMIMY